MCRSSANLRFGCGQITTRPDGFYELDGGGNPAMLAPVRDRYGEIVDMVAWFIDQPQSWWLRCGDETPFLGTQNLAMAAYYGDPIILHPHPQDWLIAGGRGVCILMWSWPLEDLFAGVGTIECSSAPLQRKLIASLRRWEPDLVVSKEVRHAA